MARGIPAATTTQPNSQAGAGRMVHAYSAVGNKARARRLGATVNRALLAVSAVALAGFGLYQIWTGLASDRAG